MTTILFIHGTSVRKAAFEAGYAVSRRGLTAALERAGRGPVSLEPCLWGDSFGSRLNANGLSVPNYHRTGLAGQHAGAAPDDSVLLWQMLGYDSLFELRGLALRPAKNMLDVGSFTDLIREAPPAAVTELLRQGGVAGTFDAARDYVLGDGDYQRAVLTAAAENDLIGPVARAILAEAIVRCPPESPPALAFDPALQEDAVEALTAALGDRTRGVEGWAANKLFVLAQRLGLVDLRYRRGGWTDALTPATGDILLYQARGGPIRQFIRDKIEAALRTDPQVVLLAHSLGGIACVDLLALPNSPRVARLITAGSQAPFLYEINALHSLSYGVPLPAGFPPWLNLYDRRDLLAYLAAKVFARDGAAPSVRDQAVDNRLPFPDSHSGYWANPAVWDAVVSVLP